MQLLIGVRMVPFLSIGLSSTFRAFDVVERGPSEQAERDGAGWTALLAMQDFNELRPLRLTRPDR